jgi:hypothetical protein
MSQSPPHPKGNEDFTLLLFSNSPLVFLKGSPLIESKHASMQGTEQSGKERMDQAKGRYQKCLLSSHFLRQPI